MDELIKKLDQLLEQKFTDTYQTLNPPVNVKILEDFSKKTGLQLPDDLIHYYINHHDGQKETICGLFFGLNFMSIENIAAEYNKIHQFFDGSLRQELSEGLRSHPENAIKRIYYHDKWIPLASDGGGNYLGIDTDPDTNGTFGQIINFGRDEDEMYVIARSFTELLGFIYDSLSNDEAYHISVDKDFLNNDKEVEMIGYKKNEQKYSHVFDALRVMLNS